MTEIFEEIFWQVADELDITAWWELFDSEEFDEVENRIYERCGAEALESAEFIAWFNEMAEDL